MDRSILDQRRLCWLALLSAAMLLPKAHATACLGPAADGSGAASIYAGHVFFVNGIASAQLGGEAARRLVKGDAICQGDVLVSATATTVQFQMADNGILVLKPATQLRLDTFEHPAASDGSEHFLATLFAGGLRAITGLIGRQHKSNYLIHTPTATIGIRGTDHEVYFVPSEGLAEERKGDAGTYSRVFSGGTLLRSAGGELKVDPNQIGFAPISGGSPVLIKTLPSFLGSMPSAFKAAAVAKRQGARSNTSTTGQAAPAAGKPASGDVAAAPASQPAADVATTDTTTVASAPSATAMADTTSAAGPSSAPVDTSTQSVPTDSSAGAQSASAGMDAATGSVAGTGSSSGSAQGADASANVYVPVNVQIGNVTVDLNASSDATIQAPDGSAYVGAHVPQATGSGYIVGGVVASGNAAAIYLDANTANPVVVGDSDQGFNYQSRRANLVEFGSNTVDGVGATWGVYDGGVTVDPNSGAEMPLSLHHFAFAPSGATPQSVISAINGTVVYDNIVGNTSPTAEDNVPGVGTLNSLRVAVSLGANPGVTSYAVSAQDHLDRAWTGDFSGFASLRQFAGGGLPLDVTCTGNGCGSGVGQGNAAGLIIGNTGSGLLTSYGLSTTSGQSIVGAAVLWNGSQTLIAPDNSAYVGVQTVADSVGMQLDMGNVITSRGGPVVITDLATGRPLTVSDSTQGILLDLSGAQLLSSGSVSVDGVTVNWGLYTGGNAISPLVPGGATIGAHHFIYAPGGATPPAVVASMGGTASYSTIIGATTPTDETGLAGGAVQSMNVAVNLGANPGITAYTVNVTDAQARSWNGAFNGFAALGDFGNGKLSLVVTCTGSNCGSGVGTGRAGGLLVGNTAGALATSYGLATTSGQRATGVAVLGRN